MERIFKIIDKASLTGKKVKILTRNSYERKIAHQYAQQKGLSHRSIIDYNKMYINQGIKKIWTSGYSKSWDEYEVTISGTPFSFVEINNGYETLIIGDKSMIPSTQVYIMDQDRLDSIKDIKLQFKTLYQKNVLMYKNKLLVM